MILDNNKWGDFLKRKPDMQPIHKWLEEKNGKLVYSNHFRFKELSNKYQEKLKEYSRKGKTKLVTKKEVEKQITEIKKKYNIQSDDEHILGLAKADDIKVLCTGDRKLHNDFTRIIKGKIYQNKKHKHLLKSDICI